MRQAMARTRMVVGGQAAGAPEAGVATQERAASMWRSDARRGMLMRAGRWWLRHWLRYAEVVGAQWR